MLLSPASERLEQVYCVYLEFANSLILIDHKSPWPLLQESNAPDIDLQWTLCTL